MKKFENIVMSKVEPSTNSLWLKDGKLLYFDGRWKPCYEEPEEVQVPTKVSQLSNDVGYVKSIDLTPIVANHKSMKLGPEIINNLGRFHLHSYDNTVLYAGNISGKYSFVHGHHYPKYPGDPAGVYSVNLVLATYNSDNFSMTFDKEIVLFTKMF